jgi:hypothetical protein
MAKEITVKSSKNEILDAYNELLDKIREQKVTEPKEEKRKAIEEKVIENAKQYSVEKILKDFADLKLEIVKNIENLSGRLIEEHKKLSELQQSIEIEKKYLDEVYEIKVNADTLSALIMAQKEKKEKFEAEIEQKKSGFDEEMELKKSQWKQEQEVFEASKKERDTATKKERQREEEEYNYNLQLKRKKENDSYEQRKAELEKELIEKKISFEKDIAQREELVSSKEKEFALLKERVDTFPAQLEKAVKDTEKTVVDRLETTYKHKSELSNKEIEGERKLNTQMIKSLESKIKEQDELIRQLTQKANDSGSQVQQIAIKAIEGASLHRIPIPISEKTGEGIKQ